MPLECLVMSDSDYIVRIHQCEDNAPHVADQLRFYLVCKLVIIDTGPTDHHINARLSKQINAIENR